MTEKNQSTAKQLSERYQAQVSEFRGETTLLLEAQHIAAASQALRDEFGFNRLSSITAVDYWPEEKPRFHVVYHFFSHAANEYLCIRCPLDGNAPSIHTIESVYPNANWPEREIYDLFGIRFEEHSDMRRIVTPSDWVGHPLRKDNPLDYEEVQFSFNAKKIAKKKKFAKP